MNEPDLSYKSYGKRVVEDVFRSDRTLRVVFVETPGLDTNARIISAIDLEKD